jgi:amidase
MSTQLTTWEQKAAAKRAETLTKIPQEWRLDPADVARAGHQRDLTGAFIQQFLNAEDVAIISKDSAEIVNHVEEGQLTAVQVATAFCKTAAIAHQIVSTPSSG